MAWRPLSIAAADGCGGGAHTGQIIQAVIKAVRRAKLFVFLRQHRHELFDEQFQAELAAAYAAALGGMRLSTVISTKRSSARAGCGAMTREAHAEIMSA